MKHDTILLNFISEFSKKQVCGCGFFDSLQTSSLYGESDIQRIVQVEEKKGSADCNGKESEDVNHVDAAEVKLEAAADAAVQVERESAPLAGEAEKIEDKPAETEKPEENKAVEIPCADKAPETLETEKAEEKKPASDEETKVEEVKLAESTTVEAPEKTPETPEAECPALDSEKKETDEKSTEIVETPEKKPEETPETPEVTTVEAPEKTPETPEAEGSVEKCPAEIIETQEKKPEEPKETEKQEPASDAEEKLSEEKPCEVSIEKPELPEVEKAADTDENVIEEKPAENSKTETSEKVEDKHVLEPQTCSVEEQKPASDAEKPKAEEEKAK